MVKRPLSYCLLSRKRSTNPTKVTEKSREINNQRTCYVSSYTLEKKLFASFILLEKRTKHYLNKTKLHQILRLVLKKRIMNYVFSFPSDK